MKTARFVLKIVAGALALAAYVCAIIGFWEELKVLDAALLKDSPQEEIGID